MKLLLLMFILSAAAVVGDVSLKLAQGTVRSVYTMAGVVVYGLCGFGWLYAMAHADLSKIATYYALFTLLALVAVGVIFFHERLLIRDWIGLAFAIVAVILLARFD